MGADYTLACQKCKKAAYIDRHGRWLGSTPHARVVEWEEFGYPTPLRRSGPVPVVTMAVLDRIEPEYREDQGGDGIMAEMRAFVAEHGGHGGVMLLSDGWDYSVDLCRAEGWTRVDMFSGREFPKEVGDVYPRTIDRF